jgi:hypothetical protein
MSHANKWIGFAAGVVTIFVAFTAGCLGDLFANLVEERSGDVTVIVINNTPYRAAFTLGGYDALHRDPPGDVSLEQQRLEAHTTTAPITLTCNRNTAIGTEALVQRVIDTEADEADDFDADAFVAVVRFSSAPADSDAAALPTAGTAEGVEVRLGVDYACGDQLIFTLLEDAAAPGGFRVAFELLHSEQDD